MAKPLSQRREYWNRRSPLPRLGLLLPRDWIGEDDEVLIDNELLCLTVLRSIFDALERPPQAITALDVGCGFGRMTLPLAHAGAVVYGIDVSDHSVERCRALARKHRLSARVRVQRMETTELGFNSALARVRFPKRFDLIVLGALCLHIIDDSELRELFDRLYALLVPGGAVVLYEAMREGNTQYKGLRNGLKVHGGSKIRPLAFFAHHLGNWGPTKVVRVRFCNETYTVLAVRVDKNSQAALKSRR